MRVRARRRKGRVTRSMYQPRGSGMIAGAFFSPRVFEAWYFARFAGPQQCGLPHVSVLKSARPP
jgi:hypothetical protein